MEPHTIYKTGRVSLFAIPSSKQAKNIFTIAYDCVTELYIKNNIHNNNNNNNIVKYCAAGKVQIQEIETPHMGIVGYVLLEHERGLTVHLADNKQIIIPSPTYKSNMNQCSFPTFNCYDRPHQVDTYSPIHILLSKYGYMLFITHQFLCTVNTTTH